MEKRVHCVCFSNSDKIEVLGPTAQNRDSCIILNLSEDFAW